MKKIRVLVVDDSALMRKMIPQIFSADPGIEVVGTAMDGVFAIKKIQELKPDVITLDMQMPRMDGLATLRHIVQNCGIPTVVVSSLAQRDAELTFRALEIGAFDFVTKPQDAISVNIGSIGAELIAKVRAACESPRSAVPVLAVPPPNPAPLQNVFTRRPSPGGLLVIGASTGGPNALTYLLPHIPKAFPAGILIVQHMPAGFTGMFAQRLNAQSMIEIKEAEDGDLILPGRALIAPGNLHMKVRRLRLGSIVVLSDAPPVNGHRPSVDVLFNSAAREYGSETLALIMTGMGNDGAEGCAALMAAGGTTVAQDEKSCVVYGMPKSAVERKAIRHVVSLDQMSAFLLNYYSTREESNGTAVR